MIKKKKIFFLVTEDWYFLSHRLNLAIYLKKKGFEIHVCCKDTGCINDILSKGIIYHELIIRRKSLSIIHFFSEALNVNSVIKKVKPDIIHLISVRPIVIGFLIATFYRKIMVCCTFTGLGSLFLSKHIFKKTLVHIIQIFLIITYRLNSTKIIVQNKDDVNYVSKFLSIDKKEVILIKGSGINTKLFNFQKEPSTKKKIVLAYTGRLLKDKGIHWLMSSFLLAKKEMDNLFLVLAGAWDRNNPSAISEKELNNIKKIKDVKYLGNVEDVREIWKKSHIAILLSKREGLPLSLIEAASMGRSIITTDVPGCREIVKNKINGFTVPAGNIEKTTVAILKLSRDTKLRKKFSKNGRRLVVNHMEESIIFLKYSEVYEKLLSINEKKR